MSPAWELAMNTRRRLIIVLGASSFAPRALFAQSKKPAVVIGWLDMGGLESGQRNLSALKEGLVALGWKEGAQFVIETRWAEGRVERLHPLALELKTRRPAVIVSVLGPATLAAVNAAPETPIVAYGASPVDLGLAKSLARPGGMVTGFTSLPVELSAKYLELLLAAAPKVKRVGFLTDRATYVHDKFLQTARRAAEHYRIEGHYAEVGKAEDLQSAIARLAKQNIQGLVVFPSAVLVDERVTIVKLALAHRWPLATGPRIFADEGGLVSYGPNILDIFRRAAIHVDKILKGAKPGDLPIEQPTHFELVVNLKTAKALGLTMPPEIMVQATQVIQ
jgi:putative ABC transport system substrate-binding protein